MEHIGNSIGFSHRLYILLLRLYPSSYRKRHGDEMIQIFEDLERENDSSVALWLFLLKDLCISLPLQYMEYFKRSKKLQLSIPAVLIAILGLGSYQVLTLNKAHSTFTNYAAFRGCTQIVSRNTTSGTCKTADGNTVNIVNFKDKWYLAGDLPCGFLCF